VLAATTWSHVSPRHDASVFWVLPTITCAKLWNHIYLLILVAWQAYRCDQRMTVAVAHAQSEEAFAFMVFLCNSCET
jgi:hypothetical protein